MPDPLSELGPRLARRRAELRLSVREAAADAGIPAATFSRVENGRMPDLGTFLKLVAWIGVPPETFFAPSTAAVNTPAAIAEHLRADPALDPQSAARIAMLVDELYATLVSRERRVTMHLRAAKTFNPLALQSMTSILDDLQRGLEQRYSA